MIEVNNATFYYKENKAIDNVNLKINENEFIAIIGVNGSGKSSLIKLISGLTLPNSGEILIDNINTKDKKQSKILRKNIGLVFQNPENQLVFSNIEDDMKFMLENFEFDKEEINKRIDDALLKVQMSEYRNKETYALSMGQKQRIAIAEMLALKPKYLILDEPTAMLDPVSKKNLLTTIKKLKQEQNLTIIYATNVISEILNADRIIALNEGKICFECTPNTIIENIEEFKKIGLEIPEIVELVYLLKEKGMKIDHNNFDLKDIVEQVVKEER